MHQKLLKSAHYIELGSYQYWPVLVPRGIRLYTYEQIPVSLKDNPYITDGYRAYLPSRLCIKRYGVAAAAAGGAPRGAPGRSSPPAPWSGVPAPPRAGRSHPARPCHSFPRVSPLVPGLLPPPGAWPRSTSDS